MAIGINDLDFDDDFMSDPNNAHTETQSDDD
jgi:hypothetical protein